MQIKFTYLLLDTLTIIGPLALSFDKKVNFASRIKPILVSISITSLLYLLWDIWFTKVGVWKFNYFWLIGPKLFSLPLEEYLFFLVVPYACLFIYDCIRIYFPSIDKPKIYSTIWKVLTGIFFLIALFNTHRLYTLVTFGLLVITLIYLQLKFSQFEKFQTPLLISWIVSIIPMFIVNGYLTGLPILIYNNTENLGIRIGTIPVEDFFYNLLYMIWMIAIYNWQNTNKSIRLRK